MKARRSRLYDNLFFFSFSIPSPRALISLCAVPLEVVFFFWQISLILLLFFLFISLCLLFVCSLFFFTYSHSPIQWLTQQKSGATLYWMLYLYQPYVQQERGLLPQKRRCGYHHTSGIPIFDSDAGGIRRRRGAKKSSTTTSCAVKNSNVVHDNSSNRSECSVALYLVLAFRRREKACAASIYRCQQMQTQAESIRRLQSGKPAGIVIVEITGK